MTTASKFFYLINVIVNFLGMIAIALLFALLGGLFEYAGIKMQFLDEINNYVNNLISSLGMTKEHYMMGLAIIGGYFLVGFVILIKAFKEAGTHKIGIHVFAMLFGGVLGGICGICARDSF